MISQGSGSSPTAVPSAADCAEAAAWIARLHGEDRTQKVEAGFKQWLAADPAHRIAFEMANDIWAETERRPRTMPPAFLGWRRPPALLRWPRPLLAMTVLIAAAVAGGVMLHYRDPGLVTRVGEQRIFTLEDGTRVSMNTATRIHVHYDSAARRIKLDQGEALFEVAKHPGWPFIVTVRHRQVQALGTAFVVRRDDQLMTVALVEGKVTVSPEGASPEAALGTVGGPGVISSSRPASLSRTTGVSSESPGEVFILSPGERLTFRKNDLPTLDRPTLERVTAWQGGHVIFDHTPLAEAVAEMNRYSEIELRIENSAAARAQVTGIFRTGDSENFAQAIATAYHLNVVPMSGRLLLVGAPQGPGPESHGNVPGDF
jgi:transmembrane sensor